MRVKIIKGQILPEWIETERYTQAMRDAVSLIEQHELEHCQCSKTIDTLIEGCDVLIDIAERRADQ